MVSKKTEVIVEQLYDAFLVSLENLRKDGAKDAESLIDFLDRQVVLGALVDSFAQLVSVDIGLAKNKGTLPIPSSGYDKK